MRALGEGDTICALATPAGSGAIGVVRLSGPAALSIVRRACERERFDPRQLHLTELRDPADKRTLDRALVAYMPGPHSYTGEDVVEVSGHGGVLNMRRLLELFVRLGARLAEPGEFTRRAFLRGRLDLTQAEAVAALIAARSERALHNAQALLGGELGVRVRRIRSGVIELAADLEACIDFADEIEAAVPRERLLEAHRRLRGEVESLAATYDRGRRLDGIAVAFAGPVNAGKSSLFNALLGGTRALVSDTPGTTRDYLEAELDWGGQAVTLVDTAGQRAHEGMSELERAGHALGSERLARCDLVIEVVDLADDRRAAAPAEARLLAANKCDLLDADERELRLSTLRGQTAACVVAVSARRGEGLSALARAAVGLVFDEGREGASTELQETVQVTQRRQHDALVRASRALSAGLDACGAELPPELVVEHDREALEALGEITGETFTEQVLDSVFSRFCIGK